MKYELSHQAAALLKFTDEKGYVCPWGNAWQELWNMLPGKKRVQTEWDPAVPLILSGWYATGNLEKSLRFREHIEWADRHGTIEEVDSYLRQLEVGLWHKWENSPYVDGG